MHASSNEIGQLLLGKYRVESVLGQGGMGIVVAARHVDLGKRVAIKKLLPHAMEYPGACERFVREARSAARLEGEHIAQVHDAGTLEDGTPFILMEYLDGQDLKKVVRERGALPAGEAALYVYQACEAVAEAHAQGIAHRDLKPANMMLVHRATGAPCIKVLDFGISKELDPAARQRDLTQSGVIMCSPSYMAPEQVSHPKEVDLRSDVWALGVVLYELVTGILPFQADSGMELLALVLQKQPQRPIELIPGLSGELEAIIMKCMAKERDKRFQTAVELMRALRPFVTTDIGQPHSRRPGVSDIDAAFPNWFASDETDGSTAPTSVLPSKRIEKTIKMPEPETGETRTLVVKKHRHDKTLKLPDTSAGETQTTVITDKQRERSQSTANADDDLVLPVQRWRGLMLTAATLLVAAILTVAAFMRRGRDEQIPSQTRQVTQTAQERPLLTIPETISFSAEAARPIDSIEPPPSAVIPVTSSQPPAPAIPQTRSTGLARAGSSSSASPETVPAAKSSAQLPLLSPFATPEAESNESSSNPKTSASVAPASTAPTSTTAPPIPTTINFDN